MISFFFSELNECKIGELNCLVQGLNEFSRTMDDLTCQLELANSLDSGIASSTCPDDEVTEDNFSEDLDPQNNSKYVVDDIHVDLCHACSQSVPLVRY